MPKSKTLNKQDVGVAYATAMGRLELACDEMHGHSLGMGCFIGKPTDLLIAGLCREISRLQEKLEKICEEAK